MDTWYKVTFSRRDIMAGQHLMLRREVSALFVAHHSPIDAAMFSDPSPKFPANFYFSPGAVRIAKVLIENYAGTACDAPPRTDLALSLGSPQLSKIPFAEE